MKLDVISIVLAVVLAVALLIVVVQEHIDIPSFSRDRLSVSSHDEINSTRPSNLKAVGNPKETGIRSFTVSKLTEMEEQNQQLRDENQVLKARMDELMNWVLASYKGKFALPEDYLADLHIAPLSDDYAITPELIELLQLSDSEEEALNDAFFDVEDYMREIEADSMYIRNPRPDKVVLTVPAFGEDGKIMQDELFTSLEQTLGVERFQRFRDIAEEAMQADFYYFGDAARTMMFELTYPDNSTDPQLLIRDAWFVQQDDNVMEIKSIETTVTELPQKYRHYLAWLPEYVAEYDVQ